MKPSSPTAIWSPSLAQLRSLRNLSWCVALLFGVALVIDANNGACSMGVPTTVINYGRSQPAAMQAAGSQLARYDSPHPRDVAVYLYGWNTPQGNNVLGRYNVTHSSGGIATVETLEVPARGVCLHYVASTVQVDTVANQAAPASSFARARVGLGRPSDWRLHMTLSADPGADGAIYRLPEWVTRVRVVGAFDSAAPAGSAVDASVKVAPANSPTMASYRQYLVSQILPYAGVVPLDIDAGFIRIFGGAVPAFVTLEIEGRS